MVFALGLFELLAILVRGLYSSVVRLCASTTPEATRDGPSHAAGKDGTPNLYGPTKVHVRRKYWTPFGPSVNLLASRLITEGYLVTYIHNGKGHSPQSFV
jgi:hypothetical protein